MNALEGLNDHFVRGAGAGGVGVEADGAAEEGCVLGDADDVGADAVAGDGREVDGVNKDLAGDFVHHAEEGENEGGFAAVMELSK